MKIYLDTGNVKEIAEATRMGILDGVTTNPSLVSKEGRDFKDLILEICQLVDGPVSAEVVSVEAEAMVKEGRELARIHPNVVVKCPLIPEGLAATKRLSGEGIRVNVTLCFSPTQALLAAKAGAWCVSPFIGRLDDVSSDGMELIRQIVTIFHNYGKLRFSHPGACGKYQTSTARGGSRVDRRRHLHHALWRLSTIGQASAHGHRTQEIPGRLGSPKRAERVTPSGPSVHQLPSAPKHAMKHGTGEFSGKGILLAGVVGP